jgi:GET complex subunit GET2
MASSPENTTSTPPKDETPSQKQARLRRERRQAKIQAEGSARLAAITNVSGRRGPPAETREFFEIITLLVQRLTTSTAEQPDALPSEQPPTTSPTQPSDHAAEIGISEHHYTPRTTPRIPQPNLFDSGRSTPQPGMQQQQQQSPGPDDPMMRILQQMVGSKTGSGTSEDNALPPGLADLFSAVQQDQQQTVPSSNTAALWRIAHAICSFALAVYVTVTSSFTGSKVARTVSRVGGEDGFASRLFLYFATVELVLQTSRYFVERGQLPQSGLMGALSRLLPEPYAGYVRLVGRYSVIWTTLVADAMVVVFVLGVVAWWKGVVET